MQKFRKICAISYVLFLTLRAVITVGKDKKKQNKRDIPTNKFKINLTNAFAKKENDRQRNNST